MTGASLDDGMRAGGGVSFPERVLRGRFPSIATAQPCLVSVFSTARAVPQQTPGRPLASTAVIMFAREESCTHRGRMREFVFSKRICLRQMAVLPRGRTTSLLPRDPTGSVCSFQFPSDRTLVMLPRSLKVVRETGGGDTLLYRLVIEQEEEWGQTSSLGCCRQSRRAFCPL